MPHWLPLVSGWALAVMGGGLLVWALWGDALAQRLRRVKKRRCPKCWYDLSHTPGPAPGVTCSECGYTARRERRLLRGRRRWRWAMVALVILVSAHLARRSPDIRERGWVAAVPTTVLICLAPQIIGDDTRLIWARLGLRLPPPAQSSWAENVFLELHRRFTVERMWQWQRLIVVRHKFVVQHHILDTRHIHWEDEDS